MFLWALASEGCLRLRPTSSSQLMLSRVLNECGQYPYVPFSLISIVPPISAANLLLSCQGEVIGNIFQFTSRLSPFLMAALEIGSPEHDLFVPGRLCLFGEHSGKLVADPLASPPFKARLLYADWAGEYRSQNPDIEVGRCIVCGTDQGLFAKCSSLVDPVFRMVRPRARQLQLPSNTEPSCRLPPRMMAHPSTLRLPLTI